MWQHISPLFGLWCCWRPLYMDADGTLGRYTWIDWNEDELFLEIANGP